MIKVTVNLGHDSLYCHLGMFVKKRIKIHSPDAFVFLEVVGMFKCQRQYRRNPWSANY